MANLEIGGMKTLAQGLDLPNSTNKVLLETWAEVQQKKVTIPSKEVKVKMNEPKTSDIDQLPVSQYC